MYTALRLLLALRVDVTSHLFLRLRFNSLNAQHYQPAPSIHSTNPKHQSLKMVQITSILLSLAAIATAIPAGSSDSSIVQSDFSISSWVDSLASDPSNALTPSEALEQYNAGVGNPLSKRQEFANCEQKGKSPAKAGDAVACINELAARGRAGENCNVNAPTISQCKIGQAQIVTVKGTPGKGPDSVNCNEIAKTAGLIMDRCFRADQTVTGQAIFANAIAVHIQEPLI
ncbi:hypothetical protein BKA63DRAFT_524092 [Paraphoma chrysanthemicola]|nr:hypothetical protein BKA63DRAFT_524092 [Paraphoma chrysanthemicola]